MSSVVTILLVDRDLLIEILNNAFFMLIEFIISKFAYETLLSREIFDSSSMCTERKEEDDSRKISVEIEMLIDDCELDLIFVFFIFLFFRLDIIFHSAERSFEMSIEFFRVCSCSKINQRDSEFSVS
jgi:hypothetical protein